MRLPLSDFAALLLVLACAPAGSTVRPDPAASGAAQVWVDAAVAESGDGSEGAPFKHWEDALALRQRPLRVRLRAGHYRGPMRLPPGVAVEGDGTGRTLLEVEAGVAVSTEQGNSGLANLSVKGGEVGLSAAGSAAVRGVTFTGQRRAAVRVARQASLTAEGCRFDAPEGMDAVGLALEESASAQLSDCRFSGPFRRAVEVKSPRRLALAGCELRGASIGVHQVGGVSALERLTVEGGAGPAVFIARGTASLSAVEVVGHEYALQTGQGTKLRVRGFRSLRAERAGLALAGTEADMEDVRVRGSGPFGAIQILDGKVSLKRFEIQAAEAYGVNARQGVLLLEQGRIEGVSDRGGEAGDGVHLRALRGRVQEVTVQQVTGACVMAAEGAKVQLASLVLTGCRMSGVLADTGAEVAGKSVRVRGSAGAAVTALEKASAEIRGLTSEGNAAGPIWAECGQEAWAHLSDVKSDMPIPRSRCVSR